MCLNFLICLSYAVMNIIVQWKIFPGGTGPSKAYRNRVVRLKVFKVNNLFFLFFAKTRKNIKKDPIYIRNFQKCQFIEKGHLLNFSSPPQRVETSHAHVWL